MSLKGNVKSNYRLHGKLSKLETVHGRSAYEIAVINGYEGTEPEWLESLKGESGYQIAVRYGYTGTEQEFFEDLTNFATLAEEAKRAEQNAKASETNASASAVSAANDAAEAQNAKTAAESAKTAAQQSEINASKSEAAAKKYADQASSAASGGVTSFNGRGGNVMPQSGDYTAAQVGAVPTSRKVNGKALSSDISLTASDVGARPSTWTPSAADVGAVKVYTSLAELGLTESTVTMNAILTAMAVPSKLLVYTSASWASGVVPGQNGTLVVDKIHNARVSATFTSSYAASNRYVGTATGGNTFGGWKKLYHEGSKPTAADVGAVSKAGDTMTKALNITNGTSTLALNRADFGVMIEGFLEGEYDAFRRYLGISNRNTRPNGNEALRYNIVENSAGVSYEVFHQGNKPTGKYTGNGSAASRAITIGGIGNYLLIHGAGFNDALITPNGRINFVYSTGAVRIGTEAKFVNGVLTLTTDDGGVNANGRVYTYQVL